MSWPSVAFADSIGNVYVANGHNTNMLYRLEVKHKHEHHDENHHHHDHNHGNEKVCCTYITPNQRLYVLTYCKEDRNYLVYELNLKKKLNFFNQELIKEDDHFGSPILVYSADGIDNDPK
jgi:hypothetical protein